MRHTHTSHIQSKNTWNVYETWTKKFSLCLSENTGLCTVHARNYRLQTGTEAKTTTTNTPFTELTKKTNSTYGQNKRIRNNDFGPKMTTSSSRTNVLFPLNENASLFVVHCFVLSGYLLFFACVFFCFFLHQRTISAAAFVIVSVTLLFGHHVLMKLVLLLLPLLLWLFFFRFVLASQFKWLFASW